MKAKFSLLLAAVLLPVWLVAQSYSQKEAVQMAATVQATPPRITVSWAPFASATGYQVYRKLKGDQSWGSSLASLGGTTNQYVDNNVSVGIYYEYKVVRTGGGTGTGYIASGINLEPVEDRGVMILLVEAAKASGLSAELAQLEEDLQNDGWGVIRHDIPAGMSVSAVRSQVQADYSADPSRVKAVYIIGHVPVPYSGRLNPDGHSDHLGAWPCDGYYGEMNGTWTDNTVNITSGQSSRNHNVPGDGKFDQSDYPSTIELQVGRVDFSNMGTPWYAFPYSEEQLLKRYLDKAHAYKTMQFVPLRRGIIFDNFQYLSDPLAGAAYRNIPALVGATNTTDIYPYADPFYTRINNQSYLWSYASGGGTWVSADNVGTTDQYASINFGGIFNMSFGSYFGDWDVTNNFLRAPLASGNGLTNVWSGIPHWFFQHMGMGDNIGYSAYVTMNNTSLYTPQSGGWQGSPYSRVHLALMGDPSLRMTVVPRPANLQVGNSNGQASFTWSAALGAVDGYHVYEVNQAAGTLVRLTTTPVTGTSFSSPAVPFVNGKRYMVRAVKLQTSNTGKYYDLSLGVQATASGTASPDCLGVPGGAAIPGSSCNDGDACTVNDVYNANCQCVGTPSPDSDGDGICNVQDNCPNAAGQIGSACDDGNPSTINDVLNANCQCTGTPVVLDCNSVPNGPAMPGTPCDDGNPNTINDIRQPNCDCVGTPVTLDCQGVPNGPALPGTACNDGNPNTGNDHWNANCQCVGQVIDCQGTPGGSALPGTACNDGNPNTGNDKWNANCQCVGQVLDCQGTPGGSALPGTACNDGNPNTGNDHWNANCQCVGQVIDCEGTPGGSALPGTACNDGNSSTINDTWSTDCECAGITPPPVDCEGTPGGSALPGTACNDGNPNTGNDHWNANCQCVGQVIDCEGTPGGSALPGTACNDGNSSTINDTWSTDCECAGITPPPVDCEGTPGGSALPGTACNDGNPNTGNDHWNANCLCVGQVIDCEGTPGGSALPGTACNDGNPNTTNDKWNANCQCVGTSANMDCNGDPGGTAFLDDCGVCSGGNTGIIPNADLDGDQVIDCLDNCPSTTNGLQADFDGDGVGDACDNCMWVYNPGQQDTDGNGIGDACQGDLPTQVPEQVGDEDGGLRVWPNPASGSVTVQCPVGDPAKLQVLDPAGRLVQEVTYGSQLDVSGFASGPYLVFALDDHGRVIARARLIRR